MGLRARLAESAFFRGGRGHIGGVGDGLDGMGVKYCGRAKHRAEGDMLQQLSKLKIEHGRNVKSMWQR